MNAIYDRIDRFVWSAEKGMTNVKLPRSLWERLFTLPWKPFEKYKLSTAPGMYREGNTLYVHPALAGDAYKVIREHDDAPTLKVKAVK